MDHARELSEYMKANLKIADAPHRLCITMSRDDIEQSLHATAIHLLYSGRINAYNQERENPETIKKVEARKEEIRAAIESKHPQYPWLKFATATSMRRPILNRGQHRIVAHKLAFPDAYKLLWTPKKCHVGWAADIVIEEKLTADILINIRLNKADSYKAGSDGDVLLAVSRGLKRLGSKKPTGGEFISWATQEYGIATTQGPRLKTILGNPRYARIAAKVCQTSRGREKFVIEHFDKLCSQHVVRSNLGSIEALLKRNEGWLGDGQYHALGALHAGGRGARWQYRELENHDDWDPPEGVRLDDYNYGEALLRLRPDELSTRWPSEFDR
ncbi:hypothetical protein GJ744_007718 [Endocarpon pusillum]|uniref:Uncharacterized protein n=1 Tax=Endocarpon pusillum TaxID=364733 RepID=A0A8H7AVF7_9EURO|nr:hypothetical protein GJ744_007718 [Endocarpon pusillum]